MQEFMVVCPLFNFQVVNMVFNLHNELSDKEINNILNLQNDKIEKGFKLTENLKLRLITQEDVEGIKRSLQYSLLSIVNLQTQNFNHYTFVISGISDSATKETSQIIELIQNAVFTMKLFGTGYLFSNNIFIYERHGGLEKPLPLKKCFDENFQYKKGTTYQLNVPEINELIALIRKTELVDKQTKEKLKIPIGRFLRGFEELDYENKLIDYLIGLESIFVKKHEPSKGALISKRCADFLAEPEENKKSINNTIREAYKIRNDIVHGSDYQNNTEKVTSNDLAQIIEIVEYCIKESILKKLLGM